MGPGVYRWAWSMHARRGLTVPIDVDVEGREFHLHNDRISYIIGVHDNGALGQLYFGPALSAGRSYRHLVPVPFHGFSNRLGAPVALEYPTSGSGDFRVPAVVVRQPDGSTVLGSPTPATGSRPASPRSRASRRRTSRPTTMPTRSRST